MKIIKKFQFDRKYLKVSCYALAVIVLSLLFNNAISNISSITENIKLVINGAKSLLATFVYGFFIAYFLNAPTRWFENKVYIRFKKFRESPRLNRIISILTVYVMFVGLLLWLLAFAFPEIVASFRGLVLTMSIAVDSIYKLGISGVGENNVIYKVVNAFNDIFYQNFTVNDLLDQAVQPLMSMLNSLPSAMAQIYMSLLTAMTNVLNFVLGLIISTYMLYEKENVLHSVEKFLRAFFRNETVEGIIVLGKRANNIVEQFTIGKILDSSIMGVLFLITSFIIQLPYRMLLCIIFAVSNMVPYFGPIFGGLVVSGIVLFQDPVKGLWTGLACLLLQQLDGNVIGPKILGDSTGIKPLSVIFAVLVGGALFQVPGMFFGAPIFAVLTSIFGNYLVMRRARKFPPATEEASAETSEGLSEDT